jgi:hypothetical protein
VILRGMGSRRRRIGRDGSAGSGMDAELWGELQRYVAGVFPAASGVQGMEPSGFGPTVFRRELQASHP